MQKQMGCRWWVARSRLVLWVKGRPEVGPCKMPRELRRRRRLWWKEIGLSSGPPQTAAAGRGDRSRKRPDWRLAPQRACRALGAPILPSAGQDARRSVLRSRPQGPQAPRVATGRNWRKPGIAEIRLTRRDLRRSPASPAAVPTASPATLAACAAAGGSYVLTTRSKYPFIFKENTSREFGRNSGRRQGEGPQRRGGTVRPGRGRGFDSPSAGSGGAGARGVPEAARRSGMRGARDAEAAEGGEETSRRTPRSAPHPRPQRPPPRNGRRAA